jgi:hypothetical protein
METERTLELLEEFGKNGIPSSAKSKRFDLVLEYQDCVMQSSEKAVAEFESGLSTEQRKLFFWANANTLAIDSFLGILKETYIFRKAQEVIDREISNEDERYSVLFAEQLGKEAILKTKVETFEACKKPIHKRIAYLVKMVKHYKWNAELATATADRLRADNRKLKDWAIQNAHKANKFDDLKTLLA